MTYDINELDDFFNDKRIFSINKIDEIKKFYSEKIIMESKDFSIYATGSYGRHEAKEDSDLDLFVIGAKYLKSIENDLLALSNSMLKKLKLPELDNNGNYFKLHTISDLQDSIGHPRDDYENYFTARMLLLMESQVLYNESFYKKFLEQIIDFYFRDIDEKNKDTFRPVFLFNDVVRYWRTICLNYENKRTEYITAGHASNNEKKAQYKLKNKKLKFHRIWLCYSTIIPLMKRDYWTQDEILTLLKKKPYERLKETSEGWGVSSTFATAAGKYKDFLQSLQDDSNKDLLKDPNSAIWRDLNNNASDFKKAIIEIIGKCPINEAKSYLMV